MVYKRVLTLFIFSYTLFFTSISLAQARIENLDTFQWKHRVILMQTKTPCKGKADVFIEQADAINDRDILWLSLIHI